MSSIMYQSTTTNLGCWPYRYIVGTVGIHLKDSLKFQESGNVVDN